MGLTLHDGAAFLTLEPHGVRAGTAWCHASVPLRMSPEELARLARGLRDLGSKGSGSFLWANEGGEVRIEVVMAKRGETHWSLRIQAPPDFLHELRLVFVGRQDELGSLAQGL